MNLLKYLWYKAAIEHRFPFIILQFVFIPLSLVYWLGISIRGLLYRLGIKKSVKLSARVISVGNITVGGTGKTPLVMYLAKLLAGQGKKVGILARGYGRISHRSVHPVRSAVKTPLLTGQGGAENSIIDDEALDNIPGVVRVAQPDRVKAAQKLIEQGIDTIILDDGFQHWRIHRDVDIVVIDSASPFGNGWLLPAGILREPRRALKRADIFVLTHCPSELAFVRAGNPASAGPGRLEEYLKQYNKPIVKTVHQPVGLFTLADNEIIPPEEWKSLKVYGLCGIGTPGHFRQTLKGLFNLSGFDSFPDHYLYTLSDMEQISKRARAVGADIVITTEKDTLRLGHILHKDSIQPPIYFLRIELKMISGGEMLDKLIKT